MGDNKNRLPSEGYSRLPTIEEVRAKTKLDKEIAELQNQLRIVTESRDFWKRKYQDAEKWNR